MKQLILFSGLFCVFIGLMALGYMAYKALKTQHIADSDKMARLQKLAIANFVGIGFATIGLILIVVSASLR